MHTKENPAGGPGMGMEQVIRCVSRLKCFTKWAGSQAELLIMAGFIVAAKVLL